MFLARSNIARQILLLDRAEKRKPSRESRANTNKFWPRYQLRPSHKDGLGGPWNQKGKHGFLVEAKYSQAWCGLTLGYAIDGSGGAGDRHTKVRRSSTSCTLNRERRREGKW